jgi:tRNA threonylcarbamoyl adenosine modification protein YeaZ
MIVLAFDTSAAHCAAAVVSGDTVLAERIEPMARGQAERLMGLLAELLAEAGLGYADLHAIGVGTGPGNFTGIRIAVSAARGLALALQRPAIGVSGLEAAACGLPRPLLAVLPAPRGRVYCQLFDDGPPEPPALRDPTTDPLPRAAALTGDGAAAVQPLVGGRLLPPSLSGPAAIARIAAARLASGTAQPRPAPLYLRPADAAPARDRPPPLLP